MIQNKLLKTLKYNNSKDIMNVVLGILNEKKNLLKGMMTLKALEN
jgi:hypothetical protein